MRSGASSDQRVVTLEETLPHYDFREVHGTWVDADPTRVFAALNAITLAEMPMARALLTMRQLPALVRERRRPQRADAPIFELLERAGFVRLGVQSERELVFGVVGRFWTLAGNAPLTLPDADAFNRFDRPGFAKAAMNFRLHPEDGGTRLTTETRISATDAAARRSFARYWRVIRPGSGLIRILWLRAVKRRAERS